MMKLTQYYHTKDPIENIRIHVCIRKITDGENENNNDKKENHHTHPVGTTFAYTFTWQEKKFSPKEIKTYSKIYEKQHSPTLTHLETIYSREVGKLSPAAKEEASQTVCLSSYVDIDNYVDKEELKRRVTSSESDLPHLVKATTSRNIGSTSTTKQTLVGGGGGFSNAARLAMRLNRENTFKSMHLIATFPNSNDQHLLCSLHYYSDCGLLSVSPGFSPMIDTENDPDLFTKGPKLLTYKITSASGAQYEYILDNLHDLDVLTNSEEEQLSQELIQQEEKKDLLRIEMWKNRAGAISNHHHHLLNVDPPLYEKKMLLQFEMVSAKRMESKDPIFIKYNLFLPFPKKKSKQFVSKWQPMDKNQPLEGQTQVATSSFLHKPCYRIAHFGNIQSFHLLKTSSSTTTTTLYSRPGHELEKKEEQTVGEEAEAEAEAEADEEEEDKMFFLDEDRFVLLLRVYSRDYYDRIRVEGYAEVTIPSTPGFYDLKNIKLWRLRQTEGDYFEDLYIGIDTNQEEERVQELFSRTNHERGHGKFTSRLGLVTESTGVSVRVRLSVAYQFPSLQDKDSSSLASQLKARINLDPNTKIIKRSVNEILKSLKMERKISKKNSTTLHSTDPQVEKTLRHMSVGGQSAVESILAGLRSKQLQFPSSTQTSIKEV